MLDHDAIRKAYPSIVTLDDSFVDYGLDDNGKKVSIVQSKVDTARATLDAEAAAICLLYTSPSPRDLSTSRMPSSA